MKAIRQLLAATALCALGVAPALAQGTTFTNGDFSNGLTGWDYLGDVSIGLYKGSNQRAVLTTAGLVPGEVTGDEDGNLSGISAAVIDDVESFAGVDVYALNQGEGEDEVEAYEGSVIKQTISVQAGDRISLDFWFGLASYETNIADYNDVAFVAVNGQVVEVVSLTSEPRSGLFSYEFLTGGTATIAFGVVDIGDYQGVTEFRIDNINVSAVPEPATYAMLLAGLALMGGIARRRQG